MYADRGGDRFCLILLLQLLSVIIGCATRNVYDGLRMHQGMDCSKLHGTDQDECNKRAGMSYDEYERQRNQERDVR